MGCAVGIPFQRKRGDGDDRAAGEPLFEIVVLGLAFRQAEPPAVIVYDDGDVVRVVEGRGGPIERRLVELPFGRSELPNELVEIMAVFLVAKLAAFRGKVKLVSPLEFRLRRQRHLAGLLAADQITAHGDERLAAFRPERRHDVARPRAPIKPGKDRLVDLERVHESDGIESQRRWLAIPDRFAGKKVGRAISAQIRDDHSVARRRQ